MMTDDEIDAAIAAIPDCPACLRPNAASRAIYRAGMRAGMLRAAQIAREEAAQVDPQHAHYRMGCVSVAIAIERAASE